MTVGRAILVGAALAVALAADASAAQITIDSRCAAGDGEVTITGSGFSPEGLVKITGLDEAADYALADERGGFSEKFLTPPVDDFRAHAHTITATDTDVRTLTATAHLTLVQELYITNLPVAGAPRELVTWLFAGWTPGRVLFGHFVYKGRLRKTYRYGTARGACGTLSTTAPRFPTRPRRGRWYIQFDQSKAYDRGTRPRRETHVTVS
jgi:hypothetical protein